MVTSEKAKEIADYILSHYPAKKSFLHYEIDWQLLFATILSAQATDNSVNKATRILFLDYPNLEDYIEANRAGIQRDIHAVGLSSSKTGYLINTAKELLGKYDGKVPKDREKLMAIKGVGYKTSGVVLAELYDFPYIPVDTHVERVTKRLGLVKEDCTLKKTEETLEKIFSGYRPIEIHRSLILFGRNICKSQRPDCEKCPFISFCKHYKEENKKGKKK